MYELSIKKAAAKAIARQAPAVRTQMVSDLEALAANPNDPALDTEPVTGTEYRRLKFRSPARDFRAIYAQDDGIRIISVKAVEPRGQAYDVRRLQR